jgi:hypothetical protein
VSTFQKRLKSCVDRGNLTVADLARWFGRPYATVRSWLKEGWKPGDGPVTQDRMEVRLRKLELVLTQHGRTLRDLPMRERAGRMADLGGSP